MANLGKVVYLTEAQAQELFSNGTITVDGVTVTYSADDLYVTPAGNIVKDVQINGTSIYNNGVANIPVAGANAEGVVKVDASFGINTTSNKLFIVNALSSQTKAGTSTYRPITPSNQHEAVFYGLAKASGDSTQSSSSNNVGVYTPEAKAAINTMIGSVPREVLLYKDDTFGNIWTEYQPTDIDVENSAVVLSDATGLPTDAISSAGTAMIVLKNRMDLQYGTIPTELYGLTRVKAIGDNKVQFYNSSGTLVSITSTDCIDMSKCKLLYRASNESPTEPLFSNFPTGHKIHVKMTLQGITNPALGLKAIDANGNILSGQSLNKHKTCGVCFPNSTFGFIGAGDIDSFSCILGLRVVDYSFGYQPYKSAVGVFEMWFWDDDLFGGSKYEIKFSQFAVNTGNKANFFSPRVGYGTGWTDAPIAQLQFTKNGLSDWVGNGSKIEIFDCGMV